MNTQWPQLSQFEYPGRFLIIGRTTESYYALYGVTARSAASRAKQYVFNKTNNTIHVEATDREIMSQGNLDLLLYNAVRIFQNTVILGNGKQVDSVLPINNAQDSLLSSLQNQTYEPDKYKTPRITGIILNNGSTVSQALHIIKSDELGNTQQQAFNLSLSENQAYFISTYAGPNIKQTPSFNGDPILLEIDFQNVQDAAQKTYDFFAPQQDKPDLRVSVIAIQTSLDLTEKGIAIINYKS